MIKAWLQIVSLESFLQFTRFAIPGYPEMWLSAICAAKFLWGLTQHVLRLDVLTLRFDRDLMLRHVTKRNCTDRTGRDLAKNDKILAADQHAVVGSYSPPFTSVLVLYTIRHRSLNNSVFLRDIEDLFHGVRSSERIDQIESFS